MEQRRRSQNLRRKEQSTRKSYYRILFLCIAVIILVLDVIFFVLPDKEISETENRSLQQFPKLNFTTLTNGKFESRFDSYVADQFPGRDAWVSVKSTVDILSGKTESNNIFLGKDGYLIQNLTVPSEEVYEKKMEEFRSLYNAHAGVRFHALIAPTALSVLSDHLPANAVAGDEEGFFERVKTDLSGMGIQFIDVRDAMKAAAKEEQVYYRTDHHWTTFGAYTAYKELAGVMNLPGGKLTFNRQLVSDSFSGTLTASSGFRTSETDPIYIYYPEPPVDYTVLYVYEGIKTASFYKSENLLVRDQYTVFFDGNHPEIIIETASGSDDVLLIIKDSYANCFVPFMAADYKKMIMVDPRYFTDDLNTLIETEGVTDILYLYNINTLAG